MTFYQAFDVASEVLDEVKSESNLEYTKTINKILTTKNRIDGAASTAGITIVVVASAYPDKWDEVIRRTADDMDH